MVLNKLRGLWKKIKSTYIEIRTVKRVYNTSNGEEITEEKNGCHLHGFLVVKPKIMKIIDIGGRGSKGIVIPADMLPRFPSNSLKVHLVERFGEIPFLVITSPEKVLEVGKS